MDFMSGCECCVSFLPAGALLQDDLFIQEGDGAPHRQIVVRISIPFPKERAIEEAVVFALPPTTGRNEWETEELKHSAVSHFAVYKSKGFHLRDDTSTNGPRL